MEPTIHIVDVVIDTFLVPLIASGKVDLEYVVKRLKRKLAERLEEGGSTREVAARHLGKTARSLYRWQDDSPETTSSGCSVWASERSTRRALMCVARTGSSPSSTSSSG